LTIWDSRSKIERFRIERFRIEDRTIADRSFQSVIGPNLESRIFNLQSSISNLRSSIFDRQSSIIIERAAETADHFCPRCKFLFGRDRNDWITDAMLEPGLHHLRRALSNQFITT